LERARVREMNSTKTQITRLLRKEQTKIEAKLWGYLRNRKYGSLKIKRQHLIKDSLRDLHLENTGFTVF